MFLRRIQVPAMALLALIIVVSTFIFPILRQTQIHVVVTEDNIKNVWVETLELPIISNIIPSNQMIGAYSIYIKIEETKETFVFHNVSAGEYIAIWREGPIWTKKGEPLSGNYTIKIILARVLANPNRI